jgi:predicted molibdopterin-dependent oxidoreductase YjgC
MTANKGESPGAVRLTFEGQPLTAPAGATVAAALLAADIVDFGSRSASGAPRGPFCMMGACFDCMVEIDGIANRQACMELVRDGQVIRRMSARFAIHAHGGSDG